VSQANSDHAGRVSGGRARLLAGLSAAKASGPNPLAIPTDRGHQRLHRLTLPSLGGNDPELNYVPMEIRMPRNQYSLIPQELFGEDFSPIIRQMRRAINSALQDVWEPMSAFSSGQREFQPEVSVSEDEREIRVQAELPGMKESDIEITYERGVLILKGEKREEEQREQKERGIRYSEWRYGAFERRIPLRVEVQESQIQASFDRGVLTIVCPKTEQSRQQTRRIEVKQGAQPQQQLEKPVGKGRGESPSEQPAAH